VLAAIQPARLTDGAGHGVNRPPSDGPQIRLRQFPFSEGKLRRWRPSRTRKPVSAALSSRASASGLASVNVPVCSAVRKPLRPTLFRQAWEIIELQKPINERTTRLSRRIKRS